MVSISLVSLCLWICFDYIKLRLVGLILYITSFILAFNNKGCVLYKEGQFSQAYQFFSQACKNDATCIEALYNMG